MRHVAAAVIALCLGAASAGAAPSHGISAFGDLKYPAEFTHFDYVNPDAPRGGKIATIGTAASGGSTLSLFYLYRNKLLFTARHYPTWLPSALVMLTWEGLKFALKGHPGKAWAVWRGLAAALGRGRF